MRLTFARDAERDLDEIVSFGIERWGEQRADAYASTLLAAAERLCAYPHIGAAVDGLAVEVRRITVGRHLLCYRVLADAVLIVRILHQQTDSPRHLR